MATEVSCGQCHGRFLVEALGVVVACPHCGIHLSIPAPEPAPVVKHDLEPAPAAVPQPAPFVFTPAPTAESSPGQGAAPDVNLFPGIPPDLPVTVGSQVLSSSIEMTVQQIAGTESPNQPAPATPSSDDAHAASVFGGADEQAGMDFHVGWHSAPNLFLAPDYVAPPPDTAISKQALQVVPSPADAADNQAATAFTPEQTATFVEFGEKTAPKEPVWTFTAPPAAPTVPEVANEPAGEVVKFSSPELLATPPASAEVPAVVPTSPAPMTPTPEERMIFGAAPAPAFQPASPTAVAESSPASLESTAQQPAAPPPFVFGAAPRPATEVRPPMIFGAAPQPGAQQPGSGSAFDSIAPATSVAEEAAAYAETEDASRQRLLLLLLLIVGSYASLVTIALAYMLVFGGRNALESLPDLVPPKDPQTNEIGWNHNPPRNDVPWGHVLHLGQSRRFGNVKVTPVKVTRGPVKFEHFSGQAENNRFPSSPVLKLWVKFENVSRDQTFAPLDAHLLFTRKSRNMGQVIYANSFVAIESQRRKGKLAAYNFDLSVHSEYLMVGQRLGHELKPGGSIETYIPSDEDAPQLNGDLVWRFQFRKGYNPKSHNGVTTLIDVRFNSRDITDDAAT